MQADLNTILPEIVLSVYAMLALFGAVYTSKDKLARGSYMMHQRGYCSWLPRGSGYRGGATTAFGGMFVDDAFARFAKVDFAICRRRPGDGHGLS